ncbi:hypothetical protein NDA11_001362 [Ustilago hordei]|uniref:Uncharacterized protein n=1 Tax=Ustilago hordei TaxID=120017 RepID=I2FYA8_USTHO|nr:uncharacterized protein UHO2_04050 [Ustilago hordei]KAJ1037247.1 hypothetical protein NDA10_006376 [Ustilago hordei]KAJ1582356.1 hypothetical protein NDA11_001362 [Ustilago hordei]KAJ1600334.1 hypothetical protein NDA14_006462 [Ustilago hordei]CCF51901.1 uncharacterized protein UHOR_04987 [Ustilago hordei]SYW86553.1 uncharacterized protein UHO2_04050 [Ustilago hordei]
MSLAPTKPDRLLVALLNRASTTRRLTILDRLSSSFEIVSERSLRLLLPGDDGLLRSLLAYEIETEGEAVTLVKWASKFTTTTNFFLVLQLNTDAPSADLFELVQKEHAPALRETYGTDEIYISPNRETAELQISLLFPDLHSTNSVDAMASRLESAALEAPLMTHAITSSEASASGFSTHSASTARTSIHPQSRASNHAPSHSTFRAGRIPSTVRSKPSIEPRLSKAAALRMGVEIQSPARGTSSPAKTADAGNVGISGVVKRPVGLPASLKAPSIAPRLNKAAVARQGGAPAGEGVGAVSTTSAGVRKSLPSSTTASGSESGGRMRKQVDFSNTPGHKRLSLAGSSVASIAPPSIAPRQNRASLSRISGSTPSSSTTTNSSGTRGGPPSAYRCNLVGRGRATSLTCSFGEGQRERQPISFDQTPGHKRTSLSLSIPSLATPSMIPRQNKASLARTRPSLPHTTNNNTSLVSPSSSAKPLRPIPTSAERGGESEGEKENQTTDYAKVARHKRHSFNFSLASLKQPTIQPRLNKAASARMFAGGIGGFKS